MQKVSTKKDFNQRAKAIVDIAVGQSTTGKIIDKNTSVKKTTNKKEKKR